MIRRFEIGNTEKELIEQLNKGDEKAFTSIFRHYYPQVFIFLSKILKDNELAEEITQESFFRIWERRKNIDINLSVEGYIFRIARNLVYDHFKKKILEEKYFLYLQHHDHETDEIGLYLDYKETKNTIDQIIKKMPNQQQLIFKLSREQGLSNQEIALKLDISKRTVEKHISNALATLHHTLPFLFILFI